MRPWLLSALCLMLVTACALLAPREGEEPVKVRVSLVEGGTGKKTPGIIRILEREGGKPVKLEGLVDRMRGFKVPADFSGWHVLPVDGAVITLAPGNYLLEAVCGLEWGGRQDLALRKGGAKEIKLALKAAFQPEEGNLVAGNTHLHLMKVSKEECEEYLKQVPAADRLKVLFISYLERKPDDKDYITNRYPLGDLPEFDATGVLVSNGQEHRHNFKAYGQGYGHVMFLGIKDLVRPVSIGPGIMGEGFDDTPLGPGIEAAKKQGGTVIWCHNNNGYEDVLNALAGRLDALNVFDGSRGGDFETNYYRYLNIGLRLPISTGTDWFLYDFARVYAEVPGKLTIPAWLEAVKKGKCQATNGPLLNLRVEGKDIGGVLKLDKPGMVTVEAGAVGRQFFGKLELMFNGKVIETAACGGKGPFQANLKVERLVDGPGWFAARVQSKEKNELGQTLFAHTSPVYVELEGKSAFHVEDGLELLKQIEEGAAAVGAEGKFSSPEARARLLGLHEQGAADLREKIAAARKGK